MNEDVHLELNTINKQRISLEELIVINSVKFANRGVLSRQIFHPSLGSWVTFEHVKSCVAARAIQYEMRLLRRMKNARHCSARTVLTNWRTICHATLQTHLKLRQLPFVLVWFWIATTKHETVQKWVLIMSKMIGWVLIIGIVLGLMEEVWGITDARLVQVRKFWRFYTVC